MNNFLWLGLGAIALFLIWKASKKESQVAVEQFLSERPAPYTLNDYRVIGF